MSCRDATAPDGPPYLAIVTHLNALPGVVAPERIRYHVRELSGTFPVDREFSVSPTDTIILSVPPATYVIDIQDLPATCAVRDGPQQAIVLSGDDNTGLIRYSVHCRGALNIETATDGHDADQSFIYRLESETGAEQLGVIGANDTIVVNDVVPGSYQLRLAGVAPNCVVITGEGGAGRVITVGDAGGTTVSFRINCSRESQRPRILAFGSSYVLGSSAFAFTVVDPNHDLDGYTWDLTDCRGNSVLPDRRKRVRRGLLNGRGRLADTLRVVGAYDIGLPSEEMVGRCTEIRVFDFESNSSEIIEHRIGSATGRAPVASAFNARLVGTQYVETTLSAIDPDGDLAGTFVAVRLRDGTLGAPDGKDDVGILDAAGFSSTTIPNLPTTDRIPWDSVYAVIIWVVDAAGNALRLEDPDTFR